MQKQSQWVKNSLKATLIALGLGGCTAALVDQKPALLKTSLAALKASYVRPVGIPEPANNPTTPEKIALGRQLFFEPALSSNGKVACATCHDPRFGFEDGRGQSVGVTGVKLGRNSPTAINLAWSEVFFWDGRADSLEAQAKGPIAAADEMGQPHDLAVATLQADPVYRAAFAKAFPAEPISIETVAKAIASFERTLVFADAPFDRWIGGNESAIPASAKRGFALFNGKAKCAGCHSGWNMSDDSFHDIGVPSEDIGRFAILPLDSMKRAVKTPGLRNIVERAPYMHNGSIATLEQVVAHYNDGFEKRPTLSTLITPLKLSKGEQRDLVAFLQTLSTPPDASLVADAQRVEALTAPPKAKVLVQTLNTAPLSPIQEINHVTVRP